MLEKIFEPKNKHKIRFATLSSKRKIADKMLDIKKQHQLKQLENLALKKFDRNYVEKLTLLLYNSKNSNNYTRIRNNLNKSVLIFNKTTNELDVTLPKLAQDSTSTNVEIEDSSSNKRHYISISNNLSTDNSQTVKNRFQINNRLIKHKIPTNIKDLIFNQKDIFIKNNNHRLNTLSNDLPKIQNLKYFNKNLNCKKSCFSINKDNNNSTKYLTNLSTFTPKQICEFDENLGKSLINGNVSHLTNTQKENLKYISELNIFPHMKNVNKKATKIIYWELYRYDKKNGKKNQSYYFKIIIQLKRIK